MPHYSLVVHEVDQTRALIWVGSLSPYNRMPVHCRLLCYPTRGECGSDTGAQPVQSVRLDRSMWRRPFSGTNKRFYLTNTFSGLTPGEAYTVKFEARVVQPDGRAAWQVLAKGVFDTLPDALPTARERPFTVALGSCFYAHYDGGQAASAYKALYEKSRYRPNIAFLVGDQVYLDINLFFPLNREDTRDRIADLYAEHWRELGSLLSRGGTWMLPDDHELWNNYPVTAGANPYVQALRFNESFRRRWVRFANEGIRKVQRVKPLRFFNIGDELSFCVLDTRMERQVDDADRPVAFMSTRHFTRLIEWIEQLDRPAVLVTQQPLLDRRGDRETDYTLANFTRQYKALVKALSACNHDVVILSGDVHYGRISEVNIGSGDGRLIEVISSPMSNLTGKDSCAASTPSQHKESRYFPVVPVAGVQPKPINRIDSVPTEAWDWDFRYLQERTKEHFMTLSFSRKRKRKHKHGSSGAPPVINMSIQAWKIRERGRQGVPKKAFSRAIVLNLS